MPGNNKRTSPAYHLPPPSPSPACATPPPPASPALAPTAITRTRPRIKKKIKDGRLVDGR